MRLSDEIRDAVMRHDKAYPNGNWRSVNVELSALFVRAAEILIGAGIDPLLLGNERRAAVLEKLGH
ncbi:hypothetical protein LX70_02654 [Defluviimonas denitrificans]|jgi:hypothetical protein|uniref:Uncharacterized protein n=1 Tax=Albidovulum denitrificans TaxID=404881 RepID=A0A2S8S6L9_9RHOB|nr:hypothetical protein [Defluviimonas denitrificans]PQV56388.1 hypothetical protein LX70_02654 [Defluviimonas denitrificans]